MKVILKGLLLGTLFTGLNLTWAEDSPETANGETNKSIIAMDADGNCFAIDTGNNVVDCPRELVEQVNRTLLAENIPADVAILQQEGKCVKVHKDKNSVVDCTEEESFALQLFTDSVDEAESKEWADKLKYYKGALGGIVTIIVATGVAVMVGGGVGLVMGLGISVPLVGVFIVGGSLVSGLLTSYHWSDFSDLSEQAEILRRVLNGADFSLLRGEQIARLQ